jgi:poly(3-hydroxybutyrate) depolymerase
MLRPEQMKAPKRLFLLFGVLIALPIVSWADDQGQVQSDGSVIVNIGESRIASDMAVYPPGGIANRPLLLMAHGNGGSGPREIKGWIALAKQHNFTIVCPTFLSAVHVMHIPEDVPYFRDCLRWIEGNLQYDKGNVFMSGVSGGGFAVNVMIWIFPGGSTSRSSSSGGHKIYRIFPCKTSKHSTSCNRSTAKIIHPRSFQGAIMENTLI